MNNIGDVLKTQGRSKAWLADQIGVNRQAIYGYCSNKYQPKLCTLKKISDVLGVGIDKLVA